MDGTTQELRQREEQNQQPTIADDGGDGDAVDQAVDGAGGSSGGMLDGLPVPSLSRRQALIIAVVVAAVVVWRIHSQRSGSGSASKEMERALEEDLDAEVSVEQDEDAEEVTIQLPSDPDDELDKDAAIIEHFKESGRLGGED